MLTPRILVVDDESQIHASLRLRLGSEYEVVCVSRISQALEAIGTKSFDLCFVDIRMPEMDGLTFIERAQVIDASLGFVILSAYDTNENLRRAIPLRVFAFIGKPFPPKHDFEALIPQWVARTQEQRRGADLVARGTAIHQDLDHAKLEREVELIASETARDALAQTANLLTTIHAHLWSVASAASRPKVDPNLSQYTRNLEEARKTADAASTVAQRFFDSAYASRDSSPAYICSGIRQATVVVQRMSAMGSLNKAFDICISTLDEQATVRELSGIEFLLMVVPLMEAAVSRAAANSTIGVHVQALSRLDAAAKEPLFRGYLWANRRLSTLSRPGALVRISAAALALARSDAEAWLKDNTGTLGDISSRGVISGIQKSKGFFATAVSPQQGRFEFVLALPT
jgi:CheY-like chemotaxis protein